MRNRLFFLLIFYWVTTLCSVAVQAKPSWTFSVVVAVEKQTADYYQTMLSKPIGQIVNDQMTTITANFNSSPNFNGIYNFEVDSLYVFDGLASTEVFRAHPHFNYCVVIDGKFTPPTVGGGWYGSNQTIYHSWDWNVNFDSGPFGPGATDGLTHEFGHSRGGVDIYGMRVEGAKNPVNGQTFEPVNSIMNFPYGNIVWDEYTTNLLNSTADGPITGDAWITSPFPAKINIKAVNAQGMTLDNVRLEVYPVDWFSYAVSSTPIWQLSTNADGIMEFPSNPYQPSTNGYPWNMRYSNFLIKATYNSVVVYKWMPLYDVQNTYFRNGPNSVYMAELVFPASTPVLKLTALSSSTVCVPGTITASLSVMGSFEPDNTFNLYLIDNFNSTPIIGSVVSTSITAISGNIPYGIRSGAHSYSIVITSTNPALRTSAYPITINATPMPPVVEWSIDLCQNSTPQPLQATGQNLLWYTNPSGGTGSTSAPIPSTTEWSLKTYFVSQTIGGCESTRAMTTVTVYPTPVAALLATGPLTASLTSATLTASGGYSYTFSGPGLLSQDHNSGIAVANVSGTYSVTVSGWAGCISTASVGLAGTDLSPTIILPQANFGTEGVGRVRNFVVNIFEVAGLPTASGQITITITVPVGYTIAFDNELTSMEVSGNEGDSVLVSNSKWTVINSIANQQLSLIMKPDEWIGGGSNSVVGFAITRTTANAGSVSNITVNVNDDASKAYDGNSSNNTYSRIINSL